MRNRRENDPYYGMGPIKKRKAKFRDYVISRKEMARRQREYFASGEESDPERLREQEERNREFIQSLKKLGVWAIVFVLFYLLLKTMAGLW
ncbi:hypothetical protein [Streptococcus sobrinus]|uniref:hypothetical protein n=1 Tax=Streptococcus sobrinus TaxID=1310 RepID=UPI0002E487A6|nr:hypothetical protein [Streptococcus sobrinus]